MGFRVIKTAIAAFMAVLIADWCRLPGPTSAGLLAILGVDVTRKEVFAPYPHVSLHPWSDFCLQVYFFTFSAFIIGCSVYTY